MNVDLGLDGNEYHHSGYSRNSVIEDKNFTIDYDKYIHFAFYICLYISHIKKTKRCLDTEALIWYLKKFKNISSGKKIRRTYFHLINNMIQDKCVKAVVENNKRYLIHNEKFILWAWKRRALKFEKELSSKFF